jgi:uncharacterized protein (TIGR00369 family)
MQGKTVRDSMVTLSHVMQPHDANPAGNIHGGVIMKLIDNAAGVVALRHSRGNVVTASIERLDFLYPVHIGNLVTLVASLNRVGRSSMEIGVRVVSENMITGEVHHTAAAYLPCGALAGQGTPRPVPPLLLENDEDRRRHENARLRSTQRAQEKTAQRQGR